MSEYRASRGGRLTLLVAVVATVGASFAAWTMFGGIGGSHSDSQADWLAVQAAIDGTGAYSDIRILADNYDVTYEFRFSGEEPSYAPVARIPGALLLLSPLALVDYWSVPRTLVAFNILILGGIGFLLFLWHPNRNPLVWALIPGVLLLSRPSIESFFWGSHATVLAFAVLLLTVSLTTDRHWGLTGVLIGVATVLKLFPGLFLIVLLVLRKWRPAVISAGIFAVVNALALALPGVSLAKAWDAIPTVSSHAFGIVGNASISSMLVTREWLGQRGAGVVFVVAALAATIVLTRRSSQEKTQRLALITCVASLALLASPLSWSHYGLLLYPPLFALFNATDRREPRIAIAIVVAIMMIRAIGGTIDTFSWLAAFTVGLAVLMSPPTLQASQKNGQQSRLPT